MWRAWYKELAMPAR